MENLEVEDPEVKRKVIETFVHKIIIYVDRIDVIFKVEPSDSNKNTDSDKVEMIRLTPNFGTIQQKYML